MTRTPSRHPPALALDGFDSTYLMQHVARRGGGRGTRSEFILGVSTFEYEIGPPATRQVPTD
jgi:hypothetical protein